MVTLITWYWELLFLLPSPMFSLAGVICWAQGTLRVLYCGLLFNFSNFIKSYTSTDAQNTILSSSLGKGVWIKLGDRKNAQTVTFLEVLTVALLHILFVYLLHLERRVVSCQKVAVNNNKSILELGKLIHLAHGLRWRGKKPLSWFMPQEIELNTFFKCKSAVSGLSEKFLYSRMAIF